MSERAHDSVAIIAVPLAHAEKVRAFANSLLEEQTPDVEGYAALIKGIGGDVRPDPAGLKLGGMGIGAHAHTDCARTKDSDYQCGDMYG